MKKRRRGDMPRDSRSPVPARGARGDRAPSSPGTELLPIESPRSSHALPVATGTALSALSARDVAVIGHVHERWMAADWQSVCAVEPEIVSRHPERGRLAAMRAAAWLQLGDRQTALMQAQMALAWGCSREALGRTLLACAHHTLARASLLARRGPQAQSHFERSAGMARMSSEVRRHVARRNAELEAELQAAKQAAAQLRKQGTPPAALSAPGWLHGMVSRCLASDDFHDCVDTVLREELHLPSDRVHLLMLLADRLLAAGDRMSGQGLLNDARRYLDADDGALRAALAARLVAFGAADAALDLTLEAALAGTPTAQAPAAAAMRAAYERARGAVLAKVDHGHELLLAHLAGELAGLKDKAAGRPLTLIEIGSTREDVPGQGSTRKLAEYCRHSGLRFITVDMDPHNSRMARDTFARLGVDFEAVTMKGEDFLREYDQPIDLVFLDAYDFDHGKHSELRQSRYQKYLGSRIDEQACHQMHLDCAQTLADKLWAHGLVCIDDTWLDGESWTAKGTLAMPYLLTHSFTLVQARNRAALLARGS